LGYGYVDGTDTINVYDTWNPDGMTPGAMTWGGSYGGLAHKSVTVMGIVPEPSTLGRTVAEDLLDPESKMQCNSCHDVHTSGVGEHQLRGYDYGFGTVRNPDGSSMQVHHGPELCRMCHLK